MKRRKTFRVMALGATLLVLGTTLGACEAKPGVAAATSSAVVTEEEMGQITAEMSKVNIKPGRFDLLFPVLFLKSGGRKILRDCPRYEDIPEKLFQIPADAQLSPLSKDLLRLRVCIAATNPPEAENMGVKPVSPQITASMDALFKKISSDPSLLQSPRFKTAVELSKQQQLAQQGAVTPQG